MLTAVLGVVAVVGVLSVSVYGLISGPVRTAAVVTAKTKATNNMITAAKILLSQAVDTDADTMPEAPAFIPDPIFPSGGILPPNLGTDQLDPWGTPYAYCTWDHGSATGSADRLSGIDDPGVNVIAIISAGQNRTFEITCNDINVNTDKGYDDSARIDDMIEDYTVTEAGSLLGGTGESIWEQVAPDEIKYDERVGIGGAADAAAKLNVTGDAKVTGDFSAAAGTVTGLAGAFTNLSSTNVNLDGGTIDGVTINSSPIGATTASTGRFSQLDVIAGGGKIQGTIIGDLAPQTGRFTTLTATGLAMANPGETANIHTANINTANVNTLTVVNTGVVTNLNSEFTQSLYDSGVPYAGLAAADGYRTGNYFRNATHLNAGTVDPARLPAFIGDVASAADPNFHNLTVTGLQGRSVSNTAPNANEVLGWNGSAWIPSTVGDGGIAVTETDPTVNDIAKTSVWTGSCPIGQIPKSGGAGDWACGIDGNDVGFPNPVTENLDMNGYKIINVSAVQMTSDFRLKKDITPMSSMLERLEQIQPVTFNWNDLANKRGYDTDKHLGLIAQEVEAVFPEAVITNEQGIKGVDYSSLTAVMLQAIRELSSQNKNLQDQINDLKKQKHQE